MNRIPAARLAVAALVLSLGACADDGPDASGAAPSGGAAAATATTPLTAGSTVEFHASEFAFTPMELTAEPGTYHGVLVNDGADRARHHVR